MIARAEADNRGVAHARRCPRRERDISAETPAPRACGSSSSSRSLTASTAQDALPAHRALPCSAPRCRSRLVSDGVDLGKGARFRRRPEAASSARPAADRRRRRPADRARARRAENAAGALTVQGAARRTGARRRRHGARASTSRACRSARRLSLQAAASARPTPRSTCRSKSATTSRGSKSPASARPAPCSCSTSAGAAARSASCPARPPTARSRCSRRPTISRARSSPSPTCGSPRAPRRPKRSSQFLDAERADADPGRCRQLSTRGARAR